MSHLEVKQMVRYLAGEATDAERFQMDEHLGACPDCAARLRGLELLRGNLDQVWEQWTAGVHGRVGRPKSLFARCKAWLWDVGCAAWSWLTAPAWPGPVLRVPFPRLAWVGVSVVLCCVAGFLATRPRGLVLADAGGAVTVLADGSVRLREGMRLEEPWRERLAPVIRGEPFAPSPALSARLGALHSQDVRLGFSERPAPSPLHPAGVVVRPGPVAFLWRGVECATNYTLIVSGGAADGIERDTGGATNVVLSPPGVSFVPGAEYEWQVAAMVNGEILPCTPVRFAVLDAAAATEIAAVEAGAGQSALVMAGVYLHYGLFDDAARRVDELRRLNPDHPIVARLEQAIAAAREVKPAP